MSNRSNREKIECYRKRLRKLEEQELMEQKRKRRRFIIYSDSEENSDNEEQSHEDNVPSNDVPTSDVSPDAPPTSDPAMDITEKNVDPPTVLAELDPEVLSALGESTEDAPKFGEKIHENLAHLWLPILRKGLNKETKDKLIKQLMVPENCTLLHAPKLNPEISAAVSDVTRHKDKRVESVQQQLGLGITALNRGLSLLLEAGSDRVQAIKHLSDSNRILCDLHFVETDARKKMVTPGLDKTFLNLIQDVTRDDTLFGNTLSEKIKASKTIEKQGLLIKKMPPVSKASPTTSSQSTNSRPRCQGNWSGPPRYPSYRGGRGGQKKPAQAGRKPYQAPQTKPSTSSKQRAPQQP